MLQYDLAIPGIAFQDLEVGFRLTRHVEVVMLLQQRICHIHDSFTCLGGD